MVAKTLLSDNTDAHPVAAQVMRPKDTSTLQAISIDLGYCLRGPNYLNSIYPHLLTSTTLWYMYLVWCIPYIAKCVLIPEYYDHGELANHLLLLVNHYHHLSMHWWQSAGHCYPHSNTLFINSPRCSSPAIDMIIAFWRPSIFLGLWRKNLTQHRRPILNQVKKVWIQAPRWYHTVLYQQFSLENRHKAGNSVIWSSHWYILTPHKTSPPFRKNYELL